MTSSNDSLYYNACFTQSGLFFSKNAKKNQAILETKELYQVNTPFNCILTPISDILTPVNDILRTHTHIILI